MDRDRARTKPAGDTSGEESERGCRPPRNARAMSCSAFLDIPLVWMLKILGKRLENFLLLLFMILLQESKLC